MVKPITGLLFMSLTGFALATPKTKTCTFNVTGMTCVTCEFTLKTAVRKLGGINKVVASTEDKLATVTFDPTKTDSKKIRTKINSVGYKANLKQCNEKKS